MLQIRLSKGSSGDDGGGSAAKTSLPVETVTVACPDHLVLADLPVAKSIGAVTASAASSVKSVGRRSRRHLGERVHFCVRCDFPIAIYGRLVPCEHAFCLACARTDSSCYLCDERIQKIQTIKLVEGIIYVCAAPHCLTSFLKRDEFEAHVHEIHADLLHPNLKREAANETNNAFNTTRPSSADAQKQTLLPEISTARAPVRSAFSPTSSSQHQDREERSRRHQSRDLSPPRTPIHPKPPPPFHNRPPQNWYPQPQSSPNFQQNTDQFSSDKTPENSFPSFMPNQPPNSYQLSINANQALVVPTPFTYAPPFPTDGSQPYYNNMLPMESGSEQHGSVLGLPPPVPSFPDNFPRPWGMGMIGLPQAGADFFQGDYSRCLPEGMMMMNNNLTTVKEPQQQQQQQQQQGSLVAVDHNDGRAVLAPQTMQHLPPPPPPLPLPLIQQQQQQQFNRGGVEGQVFGWQNDMHGHN